MPKSKKSVLRSTRTIQVSSSLRYVTHVALACVLVLGNVPLAATSAFADEAVASTGTPAIEQHDVLGELVPESDSGKTVPEPDSGKTTPDPDAGKTDLESDAGQTAPESSDATDADEAALESNGTDETALEPALLPANPWESLNPLASHSINLSTITANGTGYTWNATSKVLTFNAAANNNTYTLTQNNPQTPLAVTVIVANGVNTTVAIQNINLSTVNSPFRLEGSAKLSLQLMGSNNLQSTAVTHTVGFTNAGLHVPHTASLTLSGSGSLKATGGYYAAGIGGAADSLRSSVNTSCGVITINSGTVTAIGGIYSAGIGSGCDGNKRPNIGIVVINGGTVTAIGSQSAAGIGGGDGGDGCNTTINNGTVVAKGTVTDWSQVILGGAGIGGGTYGNGGKTTIKGGTVTATGGDDSAGIGGGSGGGGGGNGGGDGGTITISGGTVAATGNTSASGIGSGGNRYGNRSDSTGTSGKITISGGTVVATGGELRGAGIGGGSDYPVDTINISGGNVTAIGGQSATGIGSGNWARPGGVVNLIAGTVTAIGGRSSGPGIGYAAVSISSTVSVKSVSSNSRYDEAAITSLADNQLDGHYVSVRNESAPTSATKLRIFANGSTVPTNTLDLPANYRAFAYTTGSAVPQTDRIDVYDVTNTVYRGSIIALWVDSANYHRSSPNIPSFKAKSTDLPQFASVSFGGYISVRLSVVPFTYSTHVQGIGDQPPIGLGEVSGTYGQGRRLEGIRITLGDQFTHSGGVRYVTHIENYGWEDQAGRGWKTDGQLSGTSGESKRLEAIKLELTGDIKNYYDIYYQVHAENAGWLTWAKNGAPAGTAGYSLRLEAIRIVVVPKNQTIAQAYPILPVINSPAGVSAIDGYTKGDIAYNATVHLAGRGDTTFTNLSPLLGTSGQSRRLEAIRLQLPQTLPDGLRGGIEYFTHVETIGDQLPWRSGGVIGAAQGVLAGTQGKALRLEAVGVRLTGNLATQYDVYFRTHIEQIGWTGWAKNSSATATARSGSAGYSYRMEAMQIVIVKKGTIAPGIVGLSPAYYVR